MEKIAVYTGSRNIYDDMLMSAKSLIAHSDVDKVYFLIEDDIFPEPLPDIIETRNVSDQTYFWPGTPNMQSRFTYFALMRAALPLYFPDYDRILALDCDVVCVRDVSMIWNLPVGEYYFAASPEPARCKDGLVYTNVGVTLHNCKKLRESGKTDEIIDVLNHNKYTFVDQDVMNYLCQGYIYKMDSEFNATNYTKPTQAPRIVHFAGMSQDVWHRHPQAIKYRNLSWDEVMQDQKLNMKYPS